MIQRINPECPVHGSQSRLHGSDRHDDTDLFGPRGTREEQLRVLKDISSLAEASGTLRAELSSHPSILRTFIAGVAASNVLYPDLNCDEWFTLWDVPTEFEPALKQLCENLDDLVDAITILRDYAHFALHGPNGAS